MKNIKSKFYYFVLFLPFIDLITAIIARHVNSFMTPGMIIKGFLLLFFIMYIFKTNSKYNKIGKLSLLFMLLYFIFYFFTKLTLFENQFFLGELTYIFKLFYYPVVFIGLLNFYDENDFDIKTVLKMLMISLLIFTLLLLIPFFLGNAYDTYHHILKGKIGWFFSGNEISNIMVLLLASSFYFIEYTKKNIFLVFLPIFYIISQIGTKVSFLGTIIVVFLLLFFGSINSLKNNNKNFLKYIIVTSLALFYSFFSMTIQNYKYSLGNNVSEEVIVDPIVIDEPNKVEVEKIKEQIDFFFDKNQIYVVFKKLLSNRDIYLANTLSIYNNDLTSNNVLFGIGFSNTEEVNNSNIQKLIEIDILDGFFHYGVIGLIIMLFPFLVTAFLIIKNYKRPTLSSLYYVLILLLIFSISCLSGHTFTAPSVSFYIIFYLLLLLNEFKLIGRHYSLKNKISILSLHLGYGGIEKAIINQANMLCEKYDVEIICLYKVVDNIPYELNKKVKVIYLSNLKPNKEEFLKYLKQKNLIKTLSEGFKSVYILYKKHSLIKKYIYKSESKIIISTRLEFTKLLNIYGNKDAIKIAEEHVYHHENPKYFKELKNALKNIDYLLPTSKYLTEDYNKLLKNESVKVVYIPNIVSYIPKQLNGCKNVNIISVGRLSPEKGFLDLIEVFKIINLTNDNLKLTIVGDGVDKPALKKLIKNYKLSKNIKLTGFLNQKDLNKEFRKASLFVMTSLEESFGLVLIEAMSYGIPCFAFDSALGAKEIINGKNGIIIKKRNKEIMSQEIINYFKNESYQKMIKEARNTAELYSFEQIKLKWEEFILNILKK